MSVEVDTSDRIYDDFLRLLFWLPHREPSALANDKPEEDERFSDEARSAYKPVFKSDGNLNFNMGKTMILGKALS